MLCFIEYCGEVTSANKSPVAGLERMIGQVADANSHKARDFVIQGVQHVADLAFQSLLKDNRYRTFGDFFDGCGLGKPGRNF